MTALLWQTALMLLAAYFLGAFIACLVRRTFFDKPNLQTTHSRVGTAGQSTAQRQASLATAPKGPATLAAAAAAAAAAATRSSAQNDGAAASAEDTLPIAAGTSGLASVAANVAMPSEPTDFTNIAGIDQATADQLAASGVTDFAAMAAWTSDDVAKIEDVFGGKGRVARQNWIEQAKILEIGALTRYAARRARGETTVAGPRHAAPRPPSKPILQPPLPSDTRAFIRHFPDAVADRDDLKRIAGINEHVERQLNDAGVKRYNQIATWRAADVAALQMTLAVPGRVNRENWIEQAQILANGGETEFVRSQRRAAVDATTPPATDPPPEPTGDDLKLIRGIGPTIEQKLFNLGVTRYEHIARWSAPDIERVSAKLDFKDRIEREDWIGQARILASGGETDFSARSRPAPKSE